jgi:hypothetical protein
VSALASWQEVGERVKLLKELWSCPVRRALLREGRGSHSHSSSRSWIISAGCCAEAPSRAIGLN